MDAILDAGDQHNFYVCANVLPVRTAMRATINPIHPWKPKCRLGENLSPRQREVLVGLAIDKTIGEIAIDLKLSPKTVEYHKEQIVNKVGSKGLAGLAREAIRLGMVDCPCACHREERLRL